MQRATFQLQRALEDTDAPFNPVAEALSLFEPVLLFMIFPFSGARSGLRESNLCDAEFPGEAFIVG